MSHRCCWRRAAGSRKRAPATEARQKCVRGLPELSGNTSLGHVERKGDVARDPTSPALRAVPLASRASRVGLISSPTFLGRLAQRESVSLTRRRSQVQILYRPPQVRAVLRPEKVISKLPGFGGQRRGRLCPETQVNALDIRVGRASEMPHIGQLSSGSDRRTLVALA